MEEDIVTRAPARFPRRAAGACFCQDYFFFEENRNNRSCSWYYRFVTTGTAMPGWTAIYDPPNEGLP